MGMTNWKRWIVVLVAITAPISASQHLTDSNLGYTITLPDHWVREIVDTAEHRFIDTSAHYQAMIALTRYDINADTLYSYQQEWTRANFLAYILSIQSDPFSALMYYDTVSEWQNDTLWATDAFSHFFSYDTTLGDYAEYIRFTEFGHYGYELYAIGATSDMDSNVNFYKGIIDSIILPASDVSVLQPSLVRQIPRTFLSKPSYIVNLMGRSLGRNTLRNKTSQIIINRYGKSFILK
jgi:hypothetical protein